MNATEEVTEIEAIEHLDFAPRCEVKNRRIIPALKISLDFGPDCENPADWKVTMTPCCPAKEGLVALLCDPCLKSKLSHEPGIACGVCFHTFKNPRDAYLLIEPF